MLSKDLAKLDVKTLRNVNVNRDNAGAGRYMVSAFFPVRFAS